MCFDTLSLDFILLAVSLNITSSVPVVPKERLNRARAIFMPGSIQPVSRCLLESSQSRCLALVLPPNDPFRHFDNGSLVFAFSIHTCGVLHRFSLSLTTTVFSQCRIRGFEADPCRQTSEDLPPSLSQLPPELLPISPCLTSRYGTRHPTG